MPNIPSSYQAPSILFNRHVETIYPAIFRGVAIQAYSSIEIGTPDGDFLQLDWYKNKGNKKVVIVSHGLEGDSTRPYIKGMVNAFTSNGWDAIAWNFRGCGSRMNKKEILYHSGATYDLETTVDFAKNHYEQVFLIGFSLGGNITLKFLGERHRTGILGSCVFSVPIDLYSCCMELEKRHNFLYAQRFLRNLKAKIRQKKPLLNAKYPFERLNNIKTIFEFDDLFTAPLHGFTGAHDYYQKSSSLFFLKNIDVPTLLINAANDPFLSKECFPVEQAADHHYLYFENPAKGGHVGFSTFQSKNLFWSEKRALEFANSLELK